MTTVLRVIALSLFTYGHIGVTLVVASVVN